MVRRTHLSNIFGFTCAPLIAKTITLFTKFKLEILTLHNCTLIELAMIIIALSGMHNRCLENHCLKYLWWLVTSLLTAH